jgi:hypothetical protein
VGTERQVSGFETEFGTAQAANRYYENYRTGMPTPFTDLGLQATGPH